MALFAPPQAGIVWLLATRNVWDLVRPAADDGKSEDPDGMCTSAEKVWVSLFYVALLLDILDLGTDVLMVAEWAGETIPHPGPNATNVAWQRYQNDQDAGSFVLVVPQPRTSSANPNNLPPARCSSSVR